MFSSMKSTQRLSARLGAVGAESAILMLGAWVQKVTIFTIENQQAEPIRIQ